MNQTDNNFNPKEMLESLASAASNVGQFVNQIQSKLSPEQKAEFDKEMKKVQSDLSKIVKDINNVKF